MRIDLASITSSRWARGTLIASLALLPALAGAQEADPIPDKGDTTWMMVSTLLVIMMAVPGLALFYGGMVRSKNMLSVLMQVLVIFSLLTVLWCIYGYSVAFSGDATFIGNFSTAFLKGITPDSMSATFTDAVIPEYVFVAFQCTFAAITTALAVGAFAERTKFSVVLIFSVLWFTFSYLPIARAVWGGPGFLLAKGAIDFAGGTVVHINAGVAGLVGAMMVGKRLGFGTTAMPPHNLPYTLTGAGLLWVGWFGFNVGSNLEANAFAGLVFLNTFIATAAAVISWVFAEWIFRGKPTMLGGASGAIAGLVAITPSCGSVGPMGAIILGLIAGVVCLWAVAGLKKALGYDDSLDVFGVHGVGGILGALLVAVLNAPGFGGQGGDDYSIGAQLWIQTQGVLFAVIWSGLVTAVIFGILKATIGLRPTEEQEREGLDTVEHGERAYD